MLLCGEMIVVKLQQSYSHEKFRLIRENEATLQTSKRLLLEREHHIVILLISDLQLSWFIADASQRTKSH